MYYITHNTRTVPITHTTRTYTQLLRNIHSHYPDPDITPGPHYPDLHHPEHDTGHYLGQPSSRSLFPTSST